MDKKEITIFCKNDGKNHKIELGGTLEDLSKKWCRTVIDEKTGQKLDVIAALVDYKLKELEYRPMLFHQVEFIGFNHPDGRRCYLRSLCFVLQNAIRELYPDKVLVVDHSLPSGLYCEIHDTTKLEDGRKQSYFVTDDELDMIKEKMKEIIARNLPFKRVKTNSEEAMEIFRRNNQPLKAELQKSIGTFICSVYYLDGNADTFHGPLIPSTGFLKTFDITAIGDGFCLQGPQMTDFNKVMPMKRQAKIGSTLKDHSDWCSIIGIESLGNLNSAIKEGKAIEIINLSEALHERNYAKIADKIKESYKRIVMIAGPSSSGKTSSSLRIALQCKVLGLKPKVIELDNYFVDRDKTPKDEDGKYDFESLYAMDLDLLNSQLNDLLDGKEVEIPKYDFKTGSRTYTGNRLHLEDKDILILEGIHALNPELTSAVDQSKIFRVFASALTSLNIDENNNLSTSDNRLLRRMVRDNRVRGISPEDTILRWNSVRRGESRNIFPYQENADVMVNTSLVFELSVLKPYAMPILYGVPETVPEYAEAMRLIKLLSFFKTIPVGALPGTSILREFVGGSTFVY